MALTEQSTAFDVGYREGWQAAIFSTYVANLAWSAERDRVEQQRQTVERWHE